MFPKENPALFEEYNTITTSLFKDVLRYKAEPNVRAAYM